MRDGSFLMTQIEKTQTLTGGRCQMASTGGTLKSSTAAARMDSPPTHLSSHELSFCSLVPRPVRAIRVTRGGLEPSAIA